MTVYNKKFGTVFSKRARINLTHDVMFTINKSGYYKDGSHRYCLSFSFANDAWKRLSETGYISISYNPETAQFFFWEADSINGYKLFPQNNAAVVRVTIDDRTPFLLFEGGYRMLKDSETGAFYIDLKPNNGGAK